MFRLRDRKTYYWVDDKLQVHEIKRFHTKVAVSAAGILAAALCALLLVNALYYNFLELGPDRLTALNRENHLLREQLAGLGARLTEVRLSLDSLDRQGSTLRLLVDLPALDRGTKEGGTGGAVTPGGTPAGGNPVLAEAVSTLGRLSGEVRVEQESYDQILRKFESNKDYFAALPALKPMEGYYSRAGFGMRMHPLLGIFKTHEGLDIINDVGTPVYAAADGVVDMAGHSGGGYGILVVLKHGFGYQTLYAHLSKVLVREGQHVKRGDLIAKSGRTGLVTGPHLHYEVRHNGVCQNPMDYFLDDLTPAEYRQKLAAR